MNRHLERGFALAELKRFTDAAAEFTKAAGGANNGAEDPLAHAALALLAVQQDRLNEAQRHLRQAQHLQADHPVVHLAAASLAMRRQRFAQARACVRAALRHEPNDADLLSLAALVEVIAGAQEEALALSERALAIDPAHVASLECALLASHQRDDHAAFPLYLARLRQAAPLSPLPETLAARDALFDDHLDLARRHVTTALRLDPHDLGAHELRFRCEALSHPVFRFCEGRIGSWRAPAWLRLLACFVPLACLIGVGAALDLQTPRWLNALSLPFVPLALAISVLLGWPSWSLLVRAPRDKLARQLIRLAGIYFLVPAVLAGTLAATQLALVTTNATVGGVAFLSVLLLCVWVLGTNRPDLRSLTPDRQLWLLGGAFSAGLLAQIIANHSSAEWPGKLLWTLNLAALGAMLLLTPKTPAASSLSKRTAVA